MGCAAAMSQKPEKTGKRLSAGNAEEEQAAHTLKAAKEVASEIEALRHIVRDESRSAHDRREAKTELFDALERMCNIMALAVFQLSASIRSEFNTRLSEGFDELRQRLLQMGVHLLVERIDKVSKRAEEVLDGQNYPIGLATRLRAAYVDLTNNLRALGAESILSEAQQRLVLDTAGMINKLAALEEQIGMVMELGPEGVEQFPEPPAPGR